MQALPVPVLPVSDYSWWLYKLISFLNYWQVQFIYHLTAYFATAAGKLFDTFNYMTIPEEPIISRILPFVASAIALPHCVLFCNVKGHGQ